MAVTVVEVAAGVVVVVVVVVVAAAAAAAAAAVETAVQKCRKFVVDRSNPHPICF